MFRGVVVTAVESAVFPGRFARRDAERRRTLTRATVRMGLLAVFLFANLVFIALQGYHQFIGPTATPETIAAKYNLFTAFAVVMLTGSVTYIAGAYYLSMHLVTLRPPSVLRTLTTTAYGVGSYLSLQVSAELALAGTRVGRTLVRLRLRALEGLASGLGFSVSPSELNPYYTDAVWGQDDVLALADIPGVLAAPSTAVVVGVWALATSYFVYLLYAGARAHGLTRPRAGVVVLATVIAYLLAFTVLPPLSPIVDGKIITNLIV